MNAQRTDQKTDAGAGGNERKPPALSPNAGTPAAVRERSRQEAVARRAAAEMSQSGGPKTKTAAKPGHSPARSGGGKARNLFVLLAILVTSMAVGIGLFVQAGLAVGSAIVAGVVAFMMMMSIHVASRRSSEAAVLRRQVQDLQQQLAGNQGSAGMAPPRAPAAGMTPAGAPASSASGPAVPAPASGAAAPAIRQPAGTGAPPAGDRVIAPTRHEVPAAPTRHEAAATPARHEAPAAPARHEALNRPFAGSGPVSGDHETRVAQVFGGAPGSGNQNDIALRGTHPDGLEAMARATAGVTAAIGVAATATAPPRQAGRGTVTGAGSAASPTAPAMQAKRPGNPGGATERPAVRATERYNPPNLGGDHKEHVVTSVEPVAPPAHLRRAGRDDASAPESAPAVNAYGDPGKVRPGAGRGPGAAVPTLGRSAEPWPDATSELTRNPEERMAGTSAPADARGGSPFVKLGAETPPAGSGRVSADAAFEPQSLAPLAMADVVVTPVAEPPAMPPPLPETGGRNDIADSVEALRSAANEMQEADWRATKEPAASRQPAGSGSPAPVQAAPVQTAPPQNVGPVVIAATDASSWDGVGEATTAARRSDAIVEAVSAERYELFVTPIHGLDDRKARHLELMVRLNLVGGDQLDREDYDQVLADNGMRPALDLAKLSNSAKLAARLMGGRKKAAVFSNYSGEAMANDKFLDELADLLNNKEHLASHLVLSFALNDMRDFGDLHWDTLSTLQELGFRFALEQISDLDFDFDELKTRGFDFIKLDADVFLHGMPLGDTTVPAADLCRHLVEVGQTLIVGHIEDEEKLGKILGFGVLLGQGSMFGGARAVSFASLEKAQTAAA